jgi:hypothetical protein
MSDSRPNLLARVPLAVREDGWTPPPPSVPPFFAFTVRTPRPSLVRLQRDLCSLGAAGGQAPAAAGANNPPHPRRPARHRQHHDAAVVILRDIGAGGAVNIVNASPTSGPSDGRHANPR